MGIYLKWILGPNSIFDFKPFIKDLNVPSDPTLILTLSKGLNFRVASYELCGGKCRTANNK